MGLLNQNNETNAVESDYKFASKGIDDFLSEFNRDKQETGVNNDNLNDIPDFQPEEEEQPLQDLKAKTGVAKATASLLTSVLDTTLSTACSMYSGDEAANYKADAEQRDELQAAIAEYVKLKGGADIPPGIALMILVLTIYGGKFAQAHQYKKMKKITDEQAERIEELERQLKENQKTDERTDSGSDS